jgi:hypothetical protein
LVIERVCVCAVAMTERIIEYAAGRELWKLLIAGKWRHLKLQTILNQSLAGA